jgi:hypothetical protein
VPALSNGWVAPVACPFGHFVASGRKAVGASNAPIVALEAPLAPVARHVTRRRLGELLGGDEGRRLLDEADRTLRTGGVVDPERFTAAIPGVEL